MISEPESRGRAERGTLPGAANAFAVVSMEVPATLTRYGMQLAASDSPGRRDEGVRWLRAFGSRDYLLRKSLKPGRATSAAD